MIVIDYEKFLSTRFDLVIRWYFLEKAGFDAQVARVLAGSCQYKDVRDVFALLLKIDVSEVPHAADKIRRAKILESGYGLRTANQLFSMSNWSWIEGQIQIPNGEKWFRENPYPVKVDGLGLAVKRFILTLKYRKRLYWEFKGEGKTPLSLWKQHKYKKWLEMRRYSEIEEASHRMVSRMKKLEFFSTDTYVGEKGLCEKYLITYK